MKRPILVLTDFSEAADNALQHALVMRDQTNVTIILLHLCSSEAEIVKATTRLELQLVRLGVHEGIELLVKVGSINDIPAISKELDLDVIFLGTHGAHGLQKITGSHALKIVTNCETPCILVQKDSPVSTGYKKIIVTTSFHFENKQKIVAVAAIAKYFNSEVYLTYNDVDPLMKSKSLNNVKFMQQYLDKEGVKHVLKKSTNKDYNADTIKLGEEIGADLIAIMNMQKDDILGASFLGKNYEQELIMNAAKIPVLILNPKNNKVFGTTSAGFH